MLMFGGVTPQLCLIIFIILSIYFIIFIMPHETELLTFVFNFIVLFHTMFNR